MTEAEIHGSSHAKRRRTLPVRFSTVARDLIGPTKLIPAIFFWVLLASAGAQENSIAPIELPAPIQPTASIPTTVPVKPANPPRGTVYNNLGLRGGYGCGSGASYSSTAIKPTTQCGALLGIGSLELEIGVMGPQANRTQVSGYLSENLWIPLQTGSRRGSPIVVGGYTRMFETGHAFDYGLGYITPIGRNSDKRYLQFEARDYWAFANPNQHNVVFRVMWLFGGGDEQ